jgi:hypothetical protein
VAVNSGHLWVSSFSVNTVLEYNEQGSKIGQLTETFNGPKGLAVDASGNVALPDLSALIHRERVRV